MGVRDVADRATRLMVRIAVSGVALTLLGTAGLGITYNSSASLPVGLYRIQRLEGDPARGELVGVCLAGDAARLARERGYVHPEGLEPWIYGVRCAGGIAVIGKPVAGVPGDIVVVDARGVRVNGVALPLGDVLDRDSRGRPLPHAPWGTHVLGPDEFWIQSPYSTRSFDSRVFGPVVRNQIVDRRVAFLTTAPLRRESLGNTAQRIDSRAKRRMPETTSSP